MTSGGRSFGEVEVELDVPRPGEVGEGGDAWRVAGEGVCGRMVCHCARLFWLFGVAASSRTVSNPLRTYSRVDVDRR